MKRALVGVFLPLLLGSFTGCGRRAETALAGPFEALPEGATWVVHLGDNFDENFGLTQRERREQARDWMLAGVLHRFGFDAESVARSLGPMAAVRAHGSTSGIQVGLVRSAMVPSGDVVVLLPAETPDQAFDDLAEVADRFRAHPNGPPEFLRPFEYVLEHGESFATLRALAPRPFREFYASGSGYVERPIHNAIDLQAFLAGISDVTWASVENDKGEVVLGGRLFKATPYRSADLSRVAGLFRADKARVAIPSVNEAIRQFNARYGHKTYATETEKAEAEAAEAALNDRIASVKALPPRQVCGFSLDPVPSSEPQYQHARYDCSALAGTEAAMTMFYGDLLAKFWALDFEGSFPQHITDFRSYLQIAVDAAARGEVDHLNHTRIWFGVRDDAAFDRGKSLVLARTGTRVFGRSAASGDPDDEQDANATAAAFIGWWNDHFEEIALWEPEYQRLNHLMKWSILFAWLEHVGASIQLEFLGEVPARSDLWFPTWAAESARELRFQQWDKIHFFDRGYRGEDVETLEVLKSRRVDVRDATHWVRGGVTLAPPSYFDTPRRFPRPAVEGGRTAAEARASEAARGGLTTSYRDVGNSLEVRSRVGRIESEAVDIQKTPEGIWVAPRGRSQAKAVGLASELATGAEGRFDRIASYPGVARCVQLPGDGGYLVRFQGDTRWLKVPVSGSLQISPDAWIESSAINNVLNASGERITILPRANPMDGARIQIHNRGPPQGNTVVLPLPGLQIAAVRDGQGGLHLARSDLSSDFEGSLRSLSKLDTPEAGSVLNRIQIGDMEGAADTLSRNPELSRQVTQFRDSELAAARDLVGQGKIEAAARLLERLATVFRDDPEVLGPLALAHTRNADFDRAVDALNMALRGNPLSADVIASYVRNAAPSPQLEIVANALSRRPDLHGEVVAQRTPIGIGLRVNLRDNVSFKLAGKSDADAPYHVAPGYFSSEWMPPLQYSLEQLPAVRLPEGLKALSPLVIQSPRGGQIIWRDMTRRR